MFLIDLMGGEKIKLNKKIITHTLIILTIVLLAVVSLQAGSAATTNINNTTSGGISEALNNATDGDTIGLDQGIYTGSNNTNITINKNITIKGNGPGSNVIIDAQGLNGIFIIGDNVSVTFINITFLNGNSTFLTGDYNSGGAIYNNYTSSLMNVTDCTFINNNAFYGGAIYNSGNLTVNNSNFTNNEGGRGAAIYNIGDNQSIINSIFINNSAEDYGGAIANFGDNQSIINSNFTNNHAGAVSVGSGGAIYTSADNQSIINSTFTNNNANIFGGAIDNDGVRLTIDNCSFSKNNATYGGAISSILGSNLTVNNSNFVENNATLYGGAIHNSGNFTVNNSNFTQNNADYGGAILNYAVNVTINDSNFTGNNATYGGAIFNNLGANITLNSSTFTNNNATLYGGAIYNSGNMGVSNNAMNGNNASYGGAIFSNVGANVTLNSSVFTNNKAINYGGVIYNSGNMSVLGNVMNSNTAGLGQMIYNAGAMGILNLTYLDNSTKAVRDGQIVTLYANLTDDMGNTITGQNISFYVNGTYVGNVTVLEGYANLTYTVDGSLGDILPVTGTYAGNVDYPIIIRDGALAVKIFTNSTINAPDDKVGRPINISGVATDEDGNPIANTQITLTINGTTYTVTTNSNGEWNFVFTSSNSGDFTTTISWVGNSTHVGFTNSTTFNVAKLATTVTVIAPNATVGQTIIIHGVLLDEEGNIIANALLTVIVDGKAYTVTTDENGRWSLPYKTTHAGNIEVSVIFEGNNIYLASQNTTIFNVEATNGTNGTNGTTNNSAATAAMKNTGIPIIPILLVLLAMIGVVYRKR